MGIYITDNITVYEVINRILQGVNGWYSFRRNGKLAIGNFIDVNEFSLAEDTIEDHELDVIELRSGYDPIWKIRVGYARNWSVQDKDSLAGSVSEENKTRYSEKHLFSSYDQYAIQGINHSAKDLEFFTLYVDESTANLVGQEIVNRCKGLKKVYYAKVVNRLLKRKVGEIITLNTSKLGIDTKNFWIAGITENSATGLTHLLLWG